MSTENMDNFNVYWKDELTASVTFNKTDNTVSIKRHTLHPAKQLFCKDKMYMYEFLSILELRCWDRQRANLQKYLDKIGVKDYQPYEICRKTHGVKYDDFIWFKFEGESLRSKDVLVNRTEYCR